MNNQMETTLTLRAVSGFWTPAKQKACANTDLKIKLQENGFIREQAVLFFNGTAYFMKNNECIIPADKLKATNHCIVQDKKYEPGKTTLINEWRLIEVLRFEFEKVDEAGEQQMLAEREVFKQSADNYAELQKAYEEEKAAKLRLAEEIIKQGQIIAEMQKDIEALKNEQQI